jgi:hypothetical protein
LMVSPIIDSIVAVKRLLDCTIVWTASSSCCGPSPWWTLSRFESVQKVSVLIDKTHHDLIWIAWILSRSISFWNFSDPCKIECYWKSDEPFCFLFSGMISVFLLFKCHPLSKKLTFPWKIERN